MSVQRAAWPLTISTIRAVRSSQSQASYLCIRCLFRSFPSPSPPPRPQRYVSTAPHRPRDFDLEAPPRNAGVPDTSIAGVPSLVPEFAPPTQSSRPPPPPQAPASDISIPEGEAQKSTPVTNQGAAGNVASPPDATPASSARPQRKSKLRPRKAAMTLSPSAITALKELLAQPEPKMIRVGVKNRGCSGLAYNLEYVEKAGAFDESVEQEGVRVLIDSKALFSIIGSEMDWVEDKLSRRFVFKNPNITEQCGCGESFSIS